MGMQSGLSPDMLGLTAADLGLRTWRAVIAEFIATAIFVFLGAGSVVVIVNLVGVESSEDVSALIAIALVHGLAIAALVSATATISGGHINPAVTFAAVITGRLKLGTGVLYVAAQILGAVVGAVLIKAVLVDEFEGNLGAHGLGPGVDGAAEGLLAEIILTFILVFTVFAVAIDKRGFPGIAPIAIGLAVMVDHFIGVPLTGASMNPARSFGPAAISNVWTDHWIYWLGPLIGGGAAGIIYFLLYMYRNGDERGPPLAISVE